MELVRSARLEGLGCTSAICSRVAIQGKAQGGGVKFWLDQVATIKAIDKENAVLVMKDGTRQQMMLVTDFRVLYLDRSGSSEKLDLARTKLVEFLPPGK